ncbi:hypothetical protein [Variovorax sp. PBL-E5]|uniref:hypothetical protein n=1 Tax=Variovorax sp. PBL-E5 TaxID=434014 RepID=UPI00131933DF|nr:hypothetical protein [Variovorax sp. PBL-E5]VTU36130.1 hypothetical protein E5CHR_04237 [Variovorax sp. PBL-E5]
MPKQPAAAPADLVDRFRPEEDAKFELLRESGSVQLWASTIAPRVHAEPRPPRTRYHVAIGGSATYMFMSSPEIADTNFDYAVAQSGAHG